MIFCILFLIYTACQITCVSMVMKHEPSIEGRKTFVNSFILGGFALVGLLAMLPQAWEKLP